MPLNKASSCDIYGIHHGQPICWCGKKSKAETFDTAWRWAVLFVHKNVFKVAVIHHDFSDKFNGDIKERHSTDSCMEAPSTQCLPVLFRVALIINTATVSYDSTPFPCFLVQRNNLISLLSPRNLQWWRFSLWFSTQPIWDNLYGVFFFLFICLFNSLTYLF